MQIYFKGWRNMIFGAFWPLMVLVFLVSFGIGILLGWINSIIHGDHMPKIKRGEE